MSGIIPIYHPNERIDIMSASRKKKERKLLEAEKASLNTAKNGKEKKTGLDRAFRDVLIIVGIIVLAAIVLISFVSCRNYNRKNATVATIGDEKVPVSIMNYAYVDTVAQFYNNFSSYISYILDPNTALDKQTYDIDESVGTWADYFLDQAGETLEHYYNICAAAKRDGYKLSEEDQQVIDDLAANENLGTYLLNYYGEGSNKDSYIEYVTMQLTAQGYSEYFAEKYAVTDEEALEAYAADPTEYDSVTCYMVSKTADNYLEVAEDGTLPEITDAEKAKAKEDAEALKENYSTTEVTAKSYTKANVTASYGEDAAAWLFDSSRTKGDIECFANEDETEFYVFKYVEKDDYDYNTVNCRSIVIAPDATAEDPDAAKAEATATRDAVMAELTADNVQEIADKYGLTVDNGENTTKSGLDRSVVAWLFGTRSANDIKDFSSDGTYTIYIYDGEGENCNTLRVKDLVLNNKWEDVTHANEIVYKEKNFKYVRTGLIPAEFLSAN